VLFRSARCYRRYKWNPSVRRYVPEIEHVITYKRFACNTPLGDDAFRIQFPPGTKVSDHVAGKSYTVGKPGERPLPLGQVSSVSPPTPSNTVPVGRLNPPTTKPVAAAPKDAPATAPVSGRVEDRTGRAIGGAKVALFHRFGSWGSGSGIVEETRSAADGAFRFKTALTHNKKVQPAHTRDCYIVLATHSDYALGWAEIGQPDVSPSVRVTLTDPTSRTITVTDLKDRPLKGVQVWLDRVNGRGKTDPPLRSDLDLPSGTELIGASTDEEGRATVTNLPNARCSFRAVLKGYAMGLLPSGNDRVRLTRGASVSGLVKTVEGKPLEGAIVQFYGRWMDRHPYFQAVTDAKGRYELSDLPGKGYDIGRPGKAVRGSGSYSVTMKHNVYMAEPRHVELGMGQIRKDYDFSTQRGTLVKVKVVDAATGKPTAGGHVIGHGRGGEIDVFTDQRGAVAVHVLPGEASLFCWPPRGVYSAYPDRGARRVSFDARGEEIAVALRSPPIVGKLTRIRGRVVDQLGKECPDAMVYASAGRFLTWERADSILPMKTEADGRFQTEDIPAGRKLHVFAWAKDHTLAGTRVFDLPPEPKDVPDLEIQLRPARTAVVTLANDERRPVADRYLQILPIVEGEVIRFFEGMARTDSEGRISTDGVVPGLEYVLRDVTGGRPTSSSDSEDQPFQRRMRLIEKE
jgi:hypothetical protein